MGERQPDERSDQSLMMAVREGDVEKLGTLFERHHGQLFNFFLRLTGRRHLSEDLVQEVFVRLLKYRRSYRGDRLFTAWMYRIARNARIDYFGKSSRDEVSIEDGMPEHVSLQPIPSERIEENEEMRMIVSALSRLPEEKREVLLLRGVHGLKFEEIAEVLECPVNTVKGRAFRAVRELRNAVHQLKSEREI